MPGDVRTECKNALKEFATKETSRKRPARLTFYDAKVNCALSVFPISPPNQTILPTMIASDTGY